MPVVIRDLLWDDANEAHIARHGVTRADVEEVCAGNPWVGRAMGQNKRPVLGQTDSGRYLLIILGERGDGEYYPVTARDMTLPERRRYQQMRGR